MKQLEITTNKRLLIVELPNNDCEYGGLLKNRNLYFFTEKMSSEEDYPVCYPLPYDCEFICKGSDLTEDIAKGFTHNINFGTDENPDIGYHHAIKDNYWCESALQALISTIEAKGYHWGENPHKKELDRCNEYTDMFTIAKISRNFEEAESRTFNPEKCIIFEIL
ncbi:hypothetical protein [Chryseobacterium arthrosphaerae]|uniref:hypothetical protein n=1 Tax=Chryseobacterium arthrosphaerae TaxID=651561 RepID=UPI0031CF81D9